MKKYVLITIGLLFIVTACSSENIEIEKDQVEDEGNLETDDPMQAGNKNNGIKVFNISDVFTYQIKDWYVNDDTDDDGFNEIDFEGYSVKFAMVSVEDTAENESIGVFVETENDTDKETYFNMDMEFITDTQEQTHSGNGVGESKPGEKIKGFVLASLDNDAPDSFIVTIDPPFKLVGESAFDFEEGHFGEPVELKFTKE